MDKVTAIYEKCPVCAVLYNPRTSIKGFCPACAVELDKLGEEENKALLDRAGTDEVHD